jgi:hypothetical protein
MVPRKICQLKVDLRRAGFIGRKDLGIGSHTCWFHTDHPEITVTPSGNDGDDAKPYLEREVRLAIATVQLEDV